MAISIGTYRGMRPISDPRFLADENAVLAKNCWYADGDLRAVSGLTLRSDIPLTEDTRTIFPYVTDTAIYWFSWNKEVDACNSPIPADQYQRVYFTGLDVPRYTRNDIAIGANLPNASYKLGIPVPTEPIQAVLGADLPTEPEAEEGETEVDIIDASDDESRLYVYTWVSGIGEEGAPSPVSNEVVLTDPEINTVDLTLPALGVNEQDIQKRRIYRTATAGSTTDFYLVDEIDVEILTYNDAKLTQDLGSVLVTGDYFPPPEDMIGLTSLPNGVLAGFYDNIFCPAYPNIPYAWNPDYQLACDSNIVAIAATSSGAVIMTQDKPYVIQGYTPDSYSYMKLETAAACVSSRSVVDMGDSIIYASGRGLEMVTGTTPVNLTTGIYSLEQWKGLNPSSFDAYLYKNKYIAFYDNGEKQAALIFDPAGGDVTECDIYARAACRYPLSEELYIVVDDVMNIFDSDDANPMQITWRSKPFISFPYRYRACKIRGENMTCNILRDAELIKTQNIGSYIYKGYTFRIPKGRGSEWQIELTGIGAVRDVQLVATKRDFR